MEPSEVRAWFIAAIAGFAAVFHIVVAWRQWFQLCDLKRENEKLQADKKLLQDELHERTRREQQRQQREQDSIDLYGAPGGDVQALVDARQSQAEIVSAIRSLRGLGGTPGLGEYSMVTAPRGVRGVGGGYGVYGTPALITTPRMFVALEDKSHTQEPDPPEEPPKVLWDHVKDE